MTAEVERLVSRTANRLRLIQVEFADDAPQAREDCMLDALERALAEIVPDERPAFLDALRDRFPTWDNAVKGPAQDGQAVAASDDAQWQDPTFVADRLIELTRDAQPADKRRIAERLARAGLVIEGESWSLDAEEALRTKLKLATDDPLDGSRVMEMSARLVEFATSLDQLAWQIWRALAPKSTMRSDGPLLEALKQYAQGGSDVSISAPLEKLRHLTASMLASINMIGRELGRQHLRRLQPEEIEASVDAEGGKMFQAREVRCWKKYCEIAGEMDELRAERQIAEIVEQFVSKVRGSAAG
jgi:hypothetical protein